MKKKSVALLVAVVMLFGLVVGGTVAWMTAESEEVTNTFTVGNINIKLDEAPVDENGKATTEARVQENEYKLIPGSEYDKDPKVTVLANSENCYVYVKVTETNNEDDIIVWTLGDNWLSIDTEEHVYVYVDAESKEPIVVGTATTDQMLPSIIKDDTITISEKLDKDTIESLDGVVDASEYDTEEKAEAAAEDEVAARPKLAFYAYAIQAANMDDAEDAWLEAGCTCETTTP